MGGCVCVCKRSGSGLLGIRGEDGTEAQRDKVLVKDRERGRIAGNVDRDYPVSFVRGG